VAEDYLLYSSDSHVSEPGDLWVSRIDKEFQFRAPRLERRERNGRVEDFLIYEGFPPHPVSVGLGAAARDGDAAAFREAGRGYTDARPGGWDPVERLKDQDLDGVDGEVLHTTLAFRLFWLTDARLQQACFRVYNDWLAEYCSHNPRRLVGVPLISLYDIDEARKELRRSASLGLHGAMIGISPPAGQPPYTSFHYDPFWREAEELDGPLVLHVFTGSAESRLSQAYWDENLIMQNVVMPHEAQRTMAQLILSGVAERFPRLRFIAAETGTDWAPVWLKRLDSTVRRYNGRTTFATRLSLKPSDYFRRQFFFSYINEQDAVDNRHEIGLENLMWASDYPHSASTWPNSLEVVDRATAGIPAGERRMLVRDNVLRVYKLPSPVAVSR
jgi:predicted TIM-barrel fold metal-dependent hydrolase